MTRMAGDELIATVASGPGWAERNRAIPGNSYIFPDQALQMKAGQGWMYPFFRQDLVDTGLLPQRAPQGAPSEIDVPPGMTVIDAIRAGIIR